eukprot:Hpha_TRINITY_DN15922_c1_g1::TRINITY_DN15922_c1_g1_i1::g.71580::m.71580
MTRSHSVGDTPSRVAAASSTARDSKRPLFPTNGAGEGVRGLGGFFEPVFVEHRGELCLAQRLRRIIIHSMVKANLAGLRKCVGGQGDNCDAGPVPQSAGLLELPDLLARPITVKHRHVAVHEDEVVVLFRQLVHRDLPVVAHCRHDAETFQLLLDQQLVRRIVLRHEELQTSVLPLLLGRALGWALVLLSTEHRRFEQFEELLLLRRLGHHDGRALLAEACAELDLLCHTHHERDVAVCWAVCLRQLLADGLDLQKQLVDAIHRGSLRGGVEEDHVRHERLVGLRSRPTPCLWHCIVGLPHGVILLRHGLGHSGHELDEVVEVVDSEGLEPEEMAETLQNAPLFHVRHQQHQRDAVHRRSGRQELLRERDT